MKNQISFTLTLLLCLLVATIAFGQERKTFQHPTLNVQVQAFDDWVQVVHPEDEFIYEIADSESILHVIIWKTETESSGSHYLKKMADKKDLVYDADPTLGKVQNRDAWVLDATCCMKKEPVRVVLVAIPDNQESESLYLAQILCPEERLKEKEVYMEEILYSLQITR